REGDLSLLCDPRETRAACRLAFAARRHSSIREPPGTHMPAAHLRVHLRVLPRSQMVHSATRPVPPTLDAACLRSAHTQTAPDPGSPWVHAVQHLESGSTPSTPLQRERQTD